MLNNTSSPSAKAAPTARAMAGKAGTSFQYISCVEPTTSPGSNVKISKMDLTRQDRSHTKTGEA
jgi:hypothetical protein